MQVFFPYKDEKLWDGRSLSWETITLCIIKELTKLEDLLNLLLELVYNHVTQNITGMSNS